MNRDKYSLFDTDSFLWKFETNDRTEDGINLPEKYNSSLFGNLEENDEISTN